MWSVDRLSRLGPLATLDIVHRLGQWGVQVWSNREPWTEAGGELLDLLLARVGWVARMESNRRSERTKAGLRRAAINLDRLGAWFEERPLAKTRISRFGKLAPLAA